MNIMNSAEAAKKWNISRRHVEALCSEGRINGVQQMGGIWIIPGNAQKPADARIKSGKYIKNRSEGDANG